MQAEYFVELAGFDDLARLACAFREYPLRVFSQERGGKRVLSTCTELANTLLVFHCPSPGEGRYVSYQVASGKESCGVVDSTRDISSYAPIIHAESDISPLPEARGDPPDRFHPVRLRDLGSLARLTYDPEFPDERDLALYAVPHGGSWALGYVTTLEMDESYYSFNHVMLGHEPGANFLKYRGNQGQDPVFADSFEHGFTYLPIVRVREDSPVFGLGA